MGEMLGLIRAIGPQRGQELVHLAWNSVPKSIEQERVDTHIDGMVR